METIKTRAFSAGTPGEYVEAIKAVEFLLNGTEEEILKAAAGSDLWHHFADALNTVYATTEIKGYSDNWVRRARVKWLEMGFKIWDEWLEVCRPGDFSPGSMKTDVIRRRVSGMTVDTFSHFITKGYLGSECNRLRHRFLSLLKRLRELGDIRAEAEMRNVIGRMTGFKHDRDPDRDDLLHEILLKHYGLE